MQENAGARMAIAPVEQIFPEWPRKAFLDERFAAERIGVYPIGKVRHRLPVIVSVAHQRHQSDQLAIGYVAGQQYAAGWIEVAERMGQKPFFGKGVRRGAMLRKTAPMFGKAAADNPRPRQDRETFGEGCIGGKLPSAIGPCTGRKIVNMRHSALLWGDSLGSKALKLG